MPVVRRRSLSAEPPIGSSMRAIGAASEAEVQSQCAVELDEQISRKMAGDVADSLHGDESDLRLGPWRPWATHTT